MRQNNIANWKNDESLECMLFFAQRMDELLFHHTTDTYRYSVLSLRGLAAEYSNVYSDVKKGLINKKNLSHIIEEFVNRIKNDDIAKEILTKEFVKRFTKNYNSWDLKTQYENIRYIRRKLSNRAYYNCIVDQLKLLIKENKKKKEIDKNTALFVREILDCGYNENYIFKILHEVFFHKEVSSFDSLDEFFEKFDFVTLKYDVYIGYSNDMSSVFPLFNKLEISDLKVSMVDMKNVPKGIKTKRQKTILKFEDIESYDMYSAFELANAIALVVVDSYSFFKHGIKTIRTYGQVVDKENIITTIRPPKLLKNRVATLSHENSSKNAETLINVLFANYDNLSNFIRITKTHNAAILSDNISESLLSLWSILESIVEEDNNVEDNKIDTANEKKERSKIGNVIAYTMPYLKSTYIRKLVQTCMDDIIRWDKNFFDEHIANNSFGSNNIDHTFAFLAFKAMQPQRDILYSRTEQYPLLRYRIYSLSEAFANTKGIKSMIGEHTQRVEWQLHRIYRARNYIIHDAVENNKLNDELVINLHSYVDTLFMEIISIIWNSPYNDSIKDAMTSQKLSVLIMDEKMKNNQNEDIDAGNALQYLYYDFEQLK